MIQKLLQTIIIFIIIHRVENYFSTVFVKDAMKVEYPCKDNTNIVISLKTDQSYVIEQSNGSRTLSKSSVKIYYYVWINEIMDNGTEIIVKFDKDATVSLTGKDSKISNTRFKIPPDTVNNIYTLEYFNITQTEHEMIMVRGEDVPHHPPYITSLKINGIEKCRKPDMEFWGSYWPVYKYLNEAPDKFCGRRKLKTEKIETPLIVDGYETLEGWWPWHAALYRYEDGTLSYICGGTLISEYLVLTAAHCVTINGVKVNPETLGVVLGKYSLYGRDTATQSIEIFAIEVHDEFKREGYKNDIAILKLDTAAVYNNYVQPACIWFDELYDVLGTYDITGTVAGWGFDRSEKLTKKLQVATLPLVPHVTCIMLEPIFYTNMLDGKKFCAGHQNGTAPCNGDSGGGYVVFVRDPTVRFVETVVTPKSYPGAWYVRGIVSTTLTKINGYAVCDPNGYTVFIDVAKYRDWILSYMNRRYYL